MPNSPGRPFPKGDSTQVATPDPSVNGPSAARADRPLPRYSPHERLITKVAQLPLSPGARVTLQGCLQCASKVGDVDAEGRAGESFFWRAGPELARQLGLSGPSFDRYRRELREAGLLRWRRVNEREPLPSGERARTPCLVFYVDVFAIRRRLNTGTELARCDQFDRIDAITPPGASPRNSVVRIEPSISVVNQISVVTTEPEPQIEPPPTQATGGGDGFEILESLVDEWWLRIGADHLPAAARSGNTVGRVRGAIAEALRAYSPDHVRDVIDAAADERIGGAPHRWCKSRDPQVWGSGLFRGCFDRLLAAAGETRRRRTRLLERDGTANVPIRGGLVPDTDPREQARINADGAQSLLAVLGGPGRSAAGG